MSDSFYGSLSRLSNQYTSVVSPHVSPAVITSSRREDIMPSGTRALTIGRGGRSTKSTSITPADMSMPASLAGQLNPQQFAKAQEALARDTPASAPTTNPIYRIQYKATPFKVGDIVRSLATPAERDQMIPLPQPRDLAFLLDDGIAKINRKHAAAYSVDYQDLAFRYGGLHREVADTAGKLVLHSTQEVKMANALGVNYLNALLELQDWKNAGDGEAYEDHFYDHSAKVEFLSRFTLAGGVVDHGDSGASGVRHHRTGGADSAKLLDITTTGPFECFDYMNGIANVEYASCNMVIARRPMKINTLFNLGWDVPSSYSGSYQRSVNFTRDPDMGQYSETIYPIQVSFNFWPDGDKLPHRYVDPMQGVHLHGAAVVRLGHVMFRNIGNPGLQPIQGFAMTGKSNHYLPPPSTLDGFPEELSTFALSQRRPVQLMLNGNPA